MSRFKQIDIKLVSLANKLKATLRKDRPDYPEVLRTFEERRIDWVENDIRKAIIIQPDFEHTGVNSNVWNFLNIAWFNNDHSLLRPQWIKILLDKVDFAIIDKNIDQLLYDSEANLTKIQMKDLK